MAETLASLATGANKNEYLPRCNWDEYQFQNMDNDLVDADTYSLNQMTNYHQAQTKTNMGNEIPYNQYNIWNIWIRISHAKFHHKSYHDDTTCQTIDLSTLMDADIKLSDQGTHLSTISVRMNLFLAKLVGKEMIENIDYVDIPIMSFELLFPNKFPLHLVHSPINISLQSTLFTYQIQSVQYDYQECTDYQEETKLYPILSCEVSLRCLSMPFHLLQSGKIMYPLNFKRNPYKMLIFEFFNYDIDHPILESVSLRFCGMHITYYAINGEIINMEYDNQKIYAISLTPEFVSEDDMTKFFSSKRKNIPLGINLGRLDSVHIQFNFDQEYHKLYVKISGIMCNQMMIGYGMMGQRYTS